MRIIAITIGTLLTVAALLTMARIWGLGQNHPVFEHSFFSGDRPLIVVKVDTFQEADEALKWKPEVVLWLDVRYSREKVVFVLPIHRDRELLDHKAKLQNESPDKPIMIGGKLSEYPHSDIVDFFQPLYTVQQFYERYPSTRFILNMVDNVSDAHKATIEAIEKLKPNDRTLVQSDTLILMTSVKDSKPEWVYGTSVPDLVRLMTFDSLHIIPSVVFKGDVFVSPFKLKSRPAFNDSVIEEMRRRNKRIVLGPIETKEELQLALRHKADGLITDNLPELIQLLNQGPAQ